MKPTKKNRKHLIGMIILSAIIGTLVWILFEEILKIANITFSLQTGKIGFDFQMISFQINLNPGTLLGSTAGWVLFKKL